MIYVGLQGVMLHGVGAREPLAIEIRRGTRWLIEGGQGSGKSTVMALLSGVIAPERGNVWRHPGLRTGMVFAQGGLLSNHTLVENLTVPLRFVAGLSRGQALERAYLALTSLGLQANAKARPHALSPRQRKLAQYARIVALAPDLVLIDEPLGDLEFPDEAMVYDLIHTWCRAQDKALVIANGAPLHIDSSTFARVALVDGRAIMELRAHDHGS